MATDGHRADRLDGHRHAARGALGEAAAALRLLQAALRAGDEPAGRRHPRGDHHGGGDGGRAGGEPPRARPRVLPPALAADAGAPERGAREDPRAATAARPPAASSRSRCRSCSGSPTAARGLRKALEDLRWSRPRSASPRATTSSSSPTAATTRTTRPSRRSSPSRRCTTTSSARGRAPASASSSSRASRARCTTSRCSSATAPSAVNPYLAFETIHDQVTLGLIPGPAEDGREEVRQGRQQGDREGDLQDGDLDDPELPRRPGVRGDGPEPGLHRRVLHLDARRASAAWASTWSRRRRGSATSAASRPSGPSSTRASARRPVPVPRGRRAPPLQPGDDPQAPVRLPDRATTQLFKEYTALVDQPVEEPLHAARPHGPQARRRKPVPLDEVEPVEAIVRRFKTGAMSYGSISQGGARGARRRDEPHRRQVQHRRGRRGPGALR